MHKLCFQLCELCSSIIQFGCSAASDLSFPYQALGISRMGQGLGGSVLTYQIMVLVASFPSWEAL